MRSIFRKTCISALILMAVGLVFREAIANSEAEVSAKAQRFFDDYNKRTLAGGMTYEEAIAWMTKNPLATDEYKRALAKLYRDAQKKHPDIGYGADAVICGQDFPREATKREKT